MTEPVEGTYTEMDPVEPGHEIVASGPARLAVTPQVKASELVERLDMIREAQEKAMKPEVDYGVIPGTNKPALFKPGAEKLSVLFQLDIQLENEKTWGPGDHLTVVSRATVFHAPSGARLGYGEGVCTSRERKYAYRKQERTCPECSEAAVIRGKKEYGGGWLCFKKKGGCGAKWDDGDQIIEGQEVGQVDNPDLPDTWNTIVKMAEKRARVDAVLAVTGASALFTQDVEEQQADDEGQGSRGGANPEAVRRMEEARQRAREADAQAQGTFDPVSQTMTSPVGGAQDTLLTDDEVNDLIAAVQQRGLSLAQVRGMLNHVGLAHPPDADADECKIAMGRLTQRQATMAREQLDNIAPKGEA